MYKIKAAEEKPFKIWKNIPGEISQEKVEEIVKWFGFNKTDKRGAFGNKYVAKDGQRIEIKDENPHVIGIFFCALISELRSVEYSRGRHDEFVANINKLRNMVGLESLPEEK